MATGYVEASERARFEAAKFARGAPTEKQGEEYQKGKEKAVATPEAEGERLMSVKAPSEAEKTVKCEQKMRSDRGSKGRTRRRMEREAEEVRRMLFQ